MNPPDRALVLCVDEKSQIQRLDRTAPILPLRPGLPERQPQDYQGNGTIAVFAAFNILNGKVIGTCQPRLGGREFVKFLNHLEGQLTADQDVHLIMDNACTHTGAELQRWQKPNTRTRFHSWWNQVERFFGLITGRMIRRGTFHSAPKTVRNPIDNFILNKLEAQKVSARSACCKGCAIVGAPLWNTNPASTTSTWRCGTGRYHQLASACSAGTPFTSQSRSRSELTPDGYFEIPVRESIRTMFLEFDLGT